MHQTNNAGAPDVARIEDYLEAFRQRKLLVLVFALLGLILTVLYTETASQTYTATAQIRLRPTPVGSVNQNPVAPSLEEESQVVASDKVASGVRQTFPAADLTNLDVKFTPDSNVLVMSYTAPTAQAATDIANAFANVYTSERIAEAEELYLNRIAANEAAIADLEAQLTDLQTQRRAVASERLSIGSEVASDSRQTRFDEKSKELALLDSQISALTSDSNRAQGEIRAAQTSISTLTGSGPAEVLSLATTPNSPDGIPTSMLIAAGLFLGLILGLVAAFFLERLDTTARDEEDVALALGTTVMGAIPTLGIGHRGGSSSLIMLSAGGTARIAAAREAFRRLRGSLLFLSSSSGVSSVIVTSSAPGEGKSLTASNLSIALAQNGSRVVLVSADLRRPTLERLFGMEAQRPGLAEYLTQTAELNAEKVPGIENLWLIRSGQPPSNPGELLNSGRFEQMIKELEREDVEYIVVDTPPILSTADALSAARHVDGVVVVVDAERTNTSDLLQVRADLERSGAKLLGAVMNRRKFERASIFQRDKYAYYRAESRRVADQ